MNLHKTSLMKCLIWSTLKFWEGVSLSLPRKGVPVWPDGVPNPASWSWASSEPEILTRWDVVKSPKIGFHSEYRGGVTLLQKRVFLSIAKNRCDEDGSLPSSFRDSNIADDMAGGASADSEVADLQISSDIWAINKGLNDTGNGKVVYRAVFLDLMPTVFVEVWLGLVSGNDAASLDLTPKALLNAEKSGITKKAVSMAGELGSHFYRTAQVGFQVDGVHDLNHEVQIWSCAEGMGPVSKALDANAIIGATDIAVFYGTRALRFVSPTTSEDIFIDASMRSLMSGPGKGTLTRKTGVGMQTEMGMQITFSGASSSDLEGNTTPRVNQNLPKVVTYCTDGAKVTPGRYNADLQWSASPSTAPVRSESGLAGARASEFVNAKTDNGITAADLMGSATSYSATDQSKNGVMNGSFLVLGGGAFQPNRSVSGYSKGAVDKVAGSPDPFACGYAIESSDPFDMTNGGVVVLGMSEVRVAIGVFAWCQMWSDEAVGTTQSSDLQVSALSDLNPSQSTVEGLPESSIISRAVAVLVFQLWYYYPLVHPNWK